MRNHFKNSVCENCGRIYQPTSSSQQHCPQCISTVFRYIPKKLASRICMKCGYEYQPKMPNQKYCSTCRDTCRDITQKEKCETISEKIKICARCGKEYNGGGRIYCADCVPLAALERNAKTRQAISALRKQNREELPTKKTLPIYGGVFDRPIVDARAQLSVDPEKEKAIALAALKYRQEVSAQRMRIGHASLCILQEREELCRAESWEDPGKHTEHYNRRHHRTSVIGWLNKEGFYIKCETLGWRCQLCGELLTRETVTIDHIVPVADGGMNKLTNLQPLCRTCNSIKGIRTMSQARERYLFLQNHL